MTGRYLLAETSHSIQLDFNPALDHRSVPLQRWSSTTPTKVSVWSSAIRRSANLGQAASHRRGTNGLPSFIRSGEALSPSLRDTQCPCVVGSHFELL
eukprot:16446-Eustigmatos_ZCMA.PRE.1